MRPGDFGSHQLGGTTQQLLAQARESDWSSSSPERLQRMVVHRQTKTRGSKAPPRWWPAPFPTTTLVSGSFFLKSVQHASHHRLPLTSQHTADQSRSCNNSRPLSAKIGLGSLPTSSRRGRRDKVRNCASSSITQVVVGRWLFIRASSGAE